MNIILTAIGSMSALYAINSLHKAGHTVIGCDIYPQNWHYEASLCDVFAQAPSATKEREYVSFLIHLAKTNNVSHILPLTDLEIDVLNTHRSIFEEEGLVLCISSNDTLSIARDKKELARFFLNDTLVPSIHTTSILDGVDKINFPCIAKPRDGRSSKGVRILKGANELSNLNNIEKYIFQEIIDGPICTVDYARNPTTDTSFCVAREELLRTPNGAGTTVRLFHNDQLEAIVEHIGKTINIRGTVNMEFIYRNNRFFLIDINPRFSAGVAFSCKTGFCFILAHLATFSDIPFPKHVDFAESIVCKYYVES